MMENTILNGTQGRPLRTRVVQVVTSNLGAFQEQSTLENWELPTDSHDLEPLRDAARHLKTTDIPIGFPTETVYGLGADATRSAAVKGIYKTKGRPSDNPLIIHICDLTMLRSLLKPATSDNGHSKITEDPIPDIYKPLIKKYWPGPLTILLPNPQPSKLAPEVTAGLPTFGARMPELPLALSLIKLAGVPLAAPSANASTKPSPTTAEHVHHDLDGKIELILDGGPCDVGVESSVVDGLCDPPVLLRPGGLSIDKIRECPGWENVVKGYKDQSEIGSSAPRAPGMKYKHYSPKASVTLFEATKTNPDMTELPLEIRQAVLSMNPVSGSKNDIPKIGIVSTRNWRNWAGFDHQESKTHGAESHEDVTRVIESDFKEPLERTSCQLQYGEVWVGQKLSDKSTSDEMETSHKGLVARIIAIALGSDTKDIAHGLFSALRELDKRNVDAIYVEGIEDQGDIAAAVMNRLRKAASIIKA
ncbi:YrdC/RibB [Glarea lozoyensis ATCC 20868]|uniref:Threonylcarbamoyl-AMP synthase n=1 Tax=Glarea lozoyensis (strain ATCC 20868 / MF5171) TaxID=1116229 RepID=S3CKN4_GLAL2|nr:YrdC/RibB [Glarea lozoyensis ATCC 20868]EPE26285.1 YrdC/RibB [Glarea lozoyensis ATCC 20868]